MTTTEVATLGDSSLQLLPPARPASLEAKAMLLQHAEMMQTAYDLACKMVGTSMVPKRFFRKEEDATAAILYGAELGLTPIQSLQRVIAIHGMPSLEARTMVALLKPRGYKVRTVEQSDTSVTVVGRDLDGDEYRSTWTIERAKRAGYVPIPSGADSLCRPDVEDDWVTVEKFWDGKKKVSIVGNMKYITDPQAMLKAKAQAEVCREMAPDVLIGISYSAEELESERWDNEPQREPVRQRSEPITVDEIFGETPPAPEQPAPAQPNPARAQAVADAQAKLDAEQDQPAASENRPEPETEQVSDPEPGDEAPVPDDPASPAQNRQMHALFRDLDLKDRNDRLTVTGAILGFKLDSSSGLTSAEAESIIEALKLWKSGRDEDGDEVDPQDIIREILNRASLAESESSSPATDQEG